MPPTASTARPADSAAFVRSVAEHAARVAQRGLAADAAACLIVERDVLTSALAVGEAGPDGQCLFEPFLGRPVDECPVLQALRDAGGLIYADEDCAHTGGPHGEWARDSGVRTLVAVDLAVPTTKAVAVENDERLALDARIRARAAILALARTEAGGATVLSRVVMALCDLAIDGGLEAPEPGRWLEREYPSG